MPWVADQSLRAVAFGALSYAFGMLQFTVPGVDGALVDLREVGLLIGVFHLQHWAFTLIPAFITSLATPAEGSLASTIIMHAVGAPVAWFVYRWLTGKVRTLLALGAGWLLFVGLWYMLLMLPLMAVTNWTFGLIEAGAIVGTYAAVVSAIPYELVTTASVTALYVTNRRELERRRQVELELRAKQEDLSALSAELEVRVEERTAELAQANRDLEVSNEQLESFAYNASHDLKAPMRRVRGYLDLLAEELGEGASAEILGYLDKTNVCAAEMSLLIEALLRLARLGRRALEREMLDPEALVEEVWREAASAREGRDVVLDVKALPACEGDRRLIREVWANLLSNAVKYTAIREQARITVRAESRDGNTVYVVEDNGTGFDPADTEKAFGLCSRLHSREYEGTGIGLALARNIVDRHGGRIWAEAAPGAGATFRFTLTSTS